MGKKLLAITPSSISPTCGWGQRRLEAFDSTSLSSDPAMPIAIIEEDSSRMELTDH